MSTQAQIAERPHLVRGLSTVAATSANIIDMVGVGPFITLPLIVSAMGGPQAMLGWVLGALLSLCDGCVWSEFGTAYPEAGGSYAYLKHLYGPRAGRLLAFLYAWQLLFSAPLSIASGCIGFAQYASWFVPASSKPYISLSLLHVPLVISGQTFIAMGACLLALLMTYRPIAHAGRLTRALGLAVIGTLALIIAVGLTHFSAARAFSFPAGAFTLDHRFLLGLGAGLLVSAYDYWGYYNVCFLGAEVQRPERTIPRAVFGSILVVGVLYLLMNISVLGVVPWQSMMDLGTHDAAARQYTMATFMQTAFAPHTWAHTAGSATVLLIALASLASVFALMLGYSRIPYAAAQDGNFPAVFGRVHPRFHIPTVSVLTIAGVTLLWCFLRLQDVIASLVVVRIVFQFLLQGTAALLPRHRSQRKLPGRFQMPLYPLPVLAAMTGFLFILFSRKNFSSELRIAFLVLLTGVVAWFVRQRTSARATGLARSE